MTDKKSIKTFKELRDADAADLIELHDAIYESARNALMSNSEAQFYREEIYRRERREKTKRMEGMTEDMRNMTIGILVLTVLNVVIVSASVFM